MKPQHARAQRFTRRQRLTRPGEYTRVMAQARRSSDRFFTVLARSNHLPCARLGLAVSRKAARRAVDRNLIKRLAREAFRQSAPQASVDVIVFARQAAVRQSRGELRSSLNGHFRRLLADRVT